MLKNKTQLKFVRKSFFAILYGLMSAIGINVFLSHAHSYSIGVPGICKFRHQRQHQFLDDHHEHPAVPVCLESIRL